MVDPFEVSSLLTFRKQPEAFYDWIRPMIDRVLQAKPNPAHQALAEMERRGELKAVITQNIDGLHKRAGSRQVIELHGHFRTATCLHCFLGTSGESVIEQLFAGKRVPTCQRCSGVLKPDVILIGEQLPLKAAQAAFKEAKRCDLVLVAGSSLVVEPAASLPLIALQRGARLVLINYEPTPLDSLADVVIHADVAEVLPRLADSLRKR